MRAVDAAGIALVGIVFALVLRPFAPVPFIDDWAYAWPVHELLDIGRLRIPEYSNPALVHMFYGALWSATTGFSFVTLGVSTWTLWIALQIGVAALTIELGGSRVHSFVAAALTGLFPTCFGLAPTFMTDVPFLAWSTWALMLLARAVREQRDGLIWAATALACAAIGTRLVGLVLPCAMWAVLLLHTGAWGRRARVLLPPLVCIPFAAAMVIGFDSLTFASADVSWMAGAPNVRIANVTYGVRLLPKFLPLTIVQALMMVGIAVLPAAIGTRPRSALRLGVATIAGIVAAWIARLFTSWVPVGRGNLWVLAEAWGSPGMVPGWAPRFGLSNDAQFVVAAIALIALAHVCLHIKRAQFDAGAWCAVWILIGQVLMSATMWVFSNDRYALVYIPPACALLLSRLPALQMRIVGVALTILVATDVISTHDRLAYDAALWNSVERLQARGVPVSEIDGGFTVNAWLQYVRPAQAHRATNGNIAIPYFNDTSRVQFALANRELPDYVVVELVPIPGWWRSTVLYVLSPVAHANETR